jgi:hypothetical protein
MCDYSGKLVAWIDRELPDSEAAEVERHVLACAECRERVDGYEQVSARFTAYCDAAVGRKMPPRLPHRIAVLSGVAVAAVLSLVFFRVSVKRIPVPVRVADAAPVVAPEIAPRPVKTARLFTVHRPRPVARMKAPNAIWTPTGPAIQIIIPAEAVFPPGAVPEGINFIADLDIAADGSAQGLRLRP